MADHSISHLENAAAHVIDILKKIDEYRNHKIAVVGGLPIWKCIPKGRSTLDINFTISLHNAQNSIKEKLLARYPSSFTECARYFYVNPPEGKPVLVDFRWDDQPPYPPPDAMVLQNIPPGHVPYASAKDLLVFKIQSCGLRQHGWARTRDAVDAQKIVELLASSACLPLTPDEEKIIEPYIKDVVEFGRRSEMWWKEKLGILQSGGSSNHQDTES